jgi:hypothetical protein
MTFGSSWCNMAAFPPSPHVGQRHTMPNGEEYEWSGEEWLLVPDGGGGAAMPEPPGDEELYGRRKPPVGVGYWDLTAGDDGLF